jgi:hypothetical protein
VAAEREVAITLLDPLAIDTFDLGVARSDAHDYQPLPVIAGATSGKLGLLAERQLTFTPSQARTVYLYGSLGRSRIAPARLQIEQPID